MELDKILVRHTPQALQYLYEKYGFKVRHKRFLVFPDGNIEICELYNDNEKTIEFINTRLTFWPAGYKCFIDDKVFLETENFGRALEWLIGQQ